MCLFFSKSNFSFPPCVGGIVELGVLVPVVFSGIGGEIGGGEIVGGGGVIVELVVLATVVFSGIGGEIGTGE